MAKHRYLNRLLLALLALGILPFVLHSSGFGIRGLTSDLHFQTHLFSSGTPSANIAIFSHMIAGAIITIMALLQIVPGVRTRLPAIHRANGRLVVAASVVASLGGLYFIAVRGTIGGQAMDIAFALYGIALFVCAVETIRLARKREFSSHREWALRLFVLCLGSWAYRVHYGLWELVTGGLWIEPGYSGAFDLANLYLFYIPYLIGVEIYLHLTARRTATSG